MSGPPLTQPVTLTQPAQSAPISGPGTARWTWKAVLVVALLHTVALALLILQSSVEVPGHGRYFFLQDDAMISMRYARNLAEGLGPVWNRDQRVEGFTNPLWTLYMAAVHLLPFLSERTTSLAVQISNAIFDIATVVVSALLARSLVNIRYRAAATVLAGFGVAISVPLLIWSAAGFETSLQVLLVTAAALVWIRDLARPRVLAYVLLGIATLVRPDATVIFVVAAFANALVMWREGGSPRSRLLTRLLVAVLPGCILVGSIYVVREWFYGEFWPNTYSLKVVGVPDRFLRGVVYAGTYFAEGAGWLVVLPVASLIRKWDQRIAALLGLVIAQVAYVAYAGGDAFGFDRFFVVIIPLLIATCVAATTNLLERVRIGAVRPELVSGAVCAGLFVASNAVYGEITVKPIVLHITNSDGQVIALPVLQNGPGADNTMLALNLRDRASQSPTLAVFWAGVVPYFTQFPSVDLLGKADAHIAHLSATVPGAPGHNKFDFEYSLGTYTPDLIVSALTAPQAADATTVARNGVGDFAFAGRLYSDPIFLRDYLQNPIAYPQSATWLVVYQRTTSPVRLASTP